MVLALTLVLALNSVNMIEPYTWIAVIALLAVFDPLGV